MKILIIDHKPFTHELSSKVLAGHDVVIAKTVDEAYKALRNIEPFEAVLTALWLPIPLMQSNAAFGLVFAVWAKQIGVNFVAICNESNGDELCDGLELDCFGKDWRKVLEQAMSLVHSHECQANAKHRDI